MQRNRTVTVYSEAGTLGKNNLQTGSSFNFGDTAADPVQYMCGSPTNILLNSIFQDWVTVQPKKEEDAPMTKAKDKILLKL